MGRFQYTGQIWIPEVGLYYYKARLYSPFLNRFMQTDPIGYDDGPNWYAYVGNDPVNNSDPTGLFNFGCGSARENLDCKLSANSFATNTAPAPGNQSANQVRSSGNPLVDSVLPVGGKISADQTGIVLDAAEAAANEFPFLNSLLGQSIPFLRGIFIHNAFAANIRALGLPEINAEISYKNGIVVPYGTPGSVRTDAVEGPIGRPQIVYELKTGGAYVSVQEYNNYKKNLPRGTSLQVINVR